ncbi:ABC transporter permease [Cohnella sp. CIP 111063]|jgi:N-acetylglucosamine transport system permease protein|uniref:carbohydrate ABC transporter permease n=1 Tax=unclassified Cohnella TaxID=2636738 RepID=UPI000B8C3313|nr:MULTISPECIES: sugar ABC transporter permease [unclassified Cohnella]OXS58907.1 ABC transporter permease [Cohnella sp. CIP 111063]PRX72004.1 carbohydrate ABC transporter membrane protein 1 (CUT1 family) [Cohnella sp. SGD-V74]
MSMKTRRGLFIAACLLPGLALFLLFKVYPTIQIFQKSLYLWTGVGDEPKFIGLQNFVDMFHDDVFLLALRNTGFLMLVVPVLTLLIALVNASLLTQSKLKERGFYRTVFFFPSILSFVVIAILWSFIYHPTMGFVNSGLELLGLGDWAMAWLGDQRTVLWALAVTLIWQAAGYYMVMYMAGIDGISPDLYEAAGLDGATRIQQFFHITIPMLWEIIRVTIIFSINGVLTISFVIVSVMTAGGPDRHSEVVMTYLYSQAFTNSNFGYAMAIGVFIFIISLLLALISNKLTERGSH